MVAILRALVPLIVVGLMVFSIVDLLTIAEDRIRALPKFGWIVLVILLPLIGALLWLFLGRERAEPRQDGRYSPNSGGRAAPRRSGPTAPDDDPEFLARLRREREQEERIRRLEEKLAESAEPGSTPPEEPGRETRRGSTDPKGPRGADDDTPAE